MGLLSSIEPLGGRTGAAKECGGWGWGVYKRRNRSHTVSENQLPQSHQIVVTVGGFHYIHCLIAVEECNNWSNQK